MQEKIPAVLMRGGTSKALFFHGNHLLSCAADKNSVLLAAYGSPDPYGRQLDGLGGATSTTSKVAIINPSDDSNYDVEYIFGQVSIDRPLIDFKGNCGNISSAVGPFAVDSGLVKACEPITKVRILQKNTGKIIIAEVPVKDGRFENEGDYSIPGVPGTASKITLHFVDPGGSVTGKLFPTGQQTDILAIPGLGTITVTIMDAANPVVFVQASSIGLTGTEIEEIETNPAIRPILESLRSHAAVLIGVAASPEEANRISQAIPKIALVSAPQSYQAIGGITVESSQIDITARIMSMGTLHRSYAVTGAICTAGAAMIEGTVVNAVTRNPQKNRKNLTIGHPGGIIEVGAHIDSKGDSWVYREAQVGRTARRLMEGHVLVPRRIFKTY